MPDLFKELVFVPVADALTGTHRDCLIVASFGQEPEIQYSSLCLEVKILSAADLP